MGAFGHEGKLAKEGGVQEIEASGGTGDGSPYSGYNYKRDKCCLDPVCTTLVWLVGRGFLSGGDGGGHSTATMFSPLFE